MDFRKNCFAYNIFILCLLHSSVFSEAFTRTLKVEELCGLSSNSVNVGLQYYASVALKAEKNQPLDCRITLQTDKNYSVVMSFYKYNIEASDSLVFQDAGGSEMSLTGYGYFPVYKKSFIFDGPVKIHYVTNGTDFNKTSAFEFLFTQVHEKPCHMQDFECSNKRCIPSNHVCDLQDNCGDFSDERDCKTVCHSTEFQCENTMCIPQYEVCNGKNDCGDKSDESGCEITCKAPGKFLNGRIIGKNDTVYNVNDILIFRCNDGVTHVTSKCLENGEWNPLPPTCPDRTSCLTNEFLCDNSRCIDGGKVCDGKNDCGDISDEKDCNRTTCYAGDFLCDNHRCINGEKVCDGRNDCGDRSDEKCGRLCYSKEFRCRNKKCIPGNKVCDGQNDCGDISDELSCNRPCSWNEFKCRNGKCIKDIFQCNKENDCGDWSDEKNCISSDQNKVMFLELKNPWLITIFVCGGLLTIVVIVFGALLIRRSVAKKKNKPEQTQLPAAPTPTDDHLERGPNLFGRIRDSFKSSRQSAPPAQQPPPYEVPSMYPQIQATDGGIDNPEFKAEE